MCDSLTSAFLSPRLCHVAPYGRVPPTSAPRNRVIGAGGKGRKGPAPSASSRSELLAAAVSFWCPRRSPQTRPDRPPFRNTYWTPLRAALSRASWVPFCEEMPISPAIAPSGRPFSPTSEGQLLPAGPGPRPRVRRAAGGLALLLRGRLRRAPSRHCGREAGAAGRKES